MNTWNNEVGTIQPIEEIAAIVSRAGVYFHTDAVQATRHIHVSVNRLGVDLLSLSSNDIYGPKGVGALYVKEGTKLESILQGGGQERNLRSGSENIPGVVGFGAAADIMRAEMGAETARLKVLRDKLIKCVTSTIKETYLNGSATLRLPTNASIRFLYIEGESLILNLEMKGIAVSSGSACASKTQEPSHVLRCIGLPHEEAHGTLHPIGKGRAREGLGGGPDGPGRDGRAAGRSPPGFRRGGWRFPDPLHDRKKRGGVRLLRAARGPHHGGASERGRPRDSPRRPGQASAARRGLPFLRALLFFNPIALMEFRRAVQEEEKVCDELAVSLTADRRALADALRKLYLAPEEPARDRARKRRKSAEEIEEYSYRLNIESRISMLESGYVPDAMGKWLVPAAVVVATVAIRFRPRLRHS